MREIKFRAWDEVSKMTTYSIPTWNYNAHEYFDIILTDGNTDQFWGELLKGK